MMVVVGCALLSALAPSAHAKKFKYAAGPAPAADTVVTTNAADRVVLFRRPAGSDTWTRVDLSESVTVGDVTSATAFVDPSTGRASIVAITDAGVVLIEQSSSGQGTMD